MCMKIIAPKDRIYWDLYIFTIISIAAFEIPYELLIGIEDLTIQRYFDYLFLVSFGVDMILNCITEQSATNNGIFGIRKLISERYRLRPLEEEEFDSDSLLARRFPLTMYYYITSWWFIVDILAIFPFELIFGAYSGLNMSRTLRLARMPRMLRAIRVIRAVKAAKALNTLDSAFELNPSLGRLVLLCVIVPWMVHFFACVLTYFENEPGGMLYTYSQSIALIIETFVSGNIIEAETIGGKFSSYLSVLTGYIFFGMLMGNFASFFTNSDSHKQLMEEKFTQWQTIFKSNPRVFSKKIKKQILTYEKQSLQGGEFDQMNSLIMNISDADLRKRVQDLIENNKTKI
jgi:hypothetical protein